MPTKTTAIADIAHLVRFGSSHASFGQPDGQSGWVVERLAAGCPDLVFLTTPQTKEPRFVEIWYTELLEEPSSAPKTHTTLMPDEPGIAHRLPAGVTSWEVKVYALVQVEGEARADLLDSQIFNLGEPAPASHQSSIRVVADKPTDRYGTLSLWGSSFGSRVDRGRKRAPAMSDCHMGDS